MAEVFEAEWKLVLEKAKNSMDLSDTYTFLTHWRHTAAAEMNAPGTYARIQETADRILRQGGSPDATPVTDPVAWIRGRQAS